MPVCVCLQVPIATRIPVCVCAGIWCSERVRCSDTGSSYRCSRGRNTVFVYRVSFAVVLMVFSFLCFKPFYSVLFFILFSFFYFLSLFSIHNKHLLPPQRFFFPVCSKQHLLFYQRIFLNLFPILSKQYFFYFLSNNIPLFSSQ